MIPESTIAFSTRGTARRNFFASFLAAEPHDPLDAGAVVPAPIEDHDLARRREVRQIALDVHLALLPLGRRGQRDDPEHARTHPLGDGLDGAALPGAVAALEDDADLESLVLDPLLELDQLHVEPLELRRVRLALELLSRGHTALVRVIPTALLLFHGPPW